jgi:phosphoserine phosphatase
MTSPPDIAQDEILQRIVEVARHLSASAGLQEILAVIINAMRDSLGGERATVLEYDSATDELFSTVAHGLERDGDGADEIRIPADAGLAGQCAQQRGIINVPDAYADDRFNREIDRRLGFRTTSILTVPLLAPAASGEGPAELIGVAQVLNKRTGQFDARDEEVAAALGSLAAVAIKRGRLVEDRLVREKLQRDLQLARRIQQSTFPQELPELAGFGLHAWSEPAEETGGDAYDVIPVAAGALFLLADATGHGIGPALSVTECRAMLRMASRLAAAGPTGLAGIFSHLNQQLCDDLPPALFITAWLGELNTTDHVLTSLSAGQAPLVRFDAARREFEVLDADTFPLGVTEDVHAESRTIALEPGDIFAVLSDGIYEAVNASGDRFGLGRVKDVILLSSADPPARIGEALQNAVTVFTGGAPAADDRTAIIIKRAP